MTFSTAYTILQTSLLFICTRNHIVKWRKFKSAIYRIKFGQDFVWSKDFEGLESQEFLFPFQNKNIFRQRDISL